MIIKLVIYKDQLQSQSSKQAIRKNCELFRCNTKKMIIKSPNYKPCVGYKFYCKAKCSFLVNECTFHWLSKQS